MAVKLLMTWDILPGREQEYFQFVVRDFIPGVQHLGMEASDAWFTMYGKAPQILTGLQMPTVGELTNTLASSEWRELTNRLLDYVNHFTYKIIQARPGFQL